MVTPIYTSKKLEKHINKLLFLTPFQEADIRILGGWNANLFFVERKKCWLLTNAQTKYCIILTDIKTSDLEQINEVFMSCFHLQLLFDGITISSENLGRLIGKLQFHPTNNDKKTIGLQNSHFYTLEYRKAEYGSLKNIPINTIAHQLNNQPYYKGKRAISNLTSPIKELKHILDNC